MAENPSPTVRRSRALPLADRLANLPWWLLLAVLLGIVALWAVTTKESYQIIFERVREGLGITIYVTIIAYALALILGLIVGLARVSKNRVIFHLATFYVEIVRGVPMLVLLYYIAFVVGPGLVDLINSAGTTLVNAGILPSIGTKMADMAVRDLDFTARAVMALTIGYAAFLSEVFRAGIESIERGQMEAARSLGMTYWQAMRYVILPQAIRRVLPPLGNDFVAMLKDSSLVSVLGVRDITMLGKVYSTSTFRFFETYNVVAFLYLSMTIVLSLGVRYIERRMSSNDQH